ncbi:HNH endonuclease family protein [Glutamicibacter sp. NPDC058337]|uniref:HNH endonuclease family protein n=1 Tax=Glutamicibacter sp. NPDC058337 TaxID=3346452 RepID=UPI00364D21AC
MRGKLRWAGVSALIIGLGLSGCSAVDSVDLSSWHSSSAASVSPSLKQDYALALKQLDQVEVKGRTAKTGYARDQFGKGWKDPDRNGCDARNDVLTRDLHEAKFKPGSAQCTVLSGIFTDPYTGEQIDFVRGPSTSTAVQIDHVVALSDSWQKGAQLWSSEKRLQFANDPLNLLASDGPTNAAKGDKDAATWLPPNKEFRCDYVARQTEVKAKYGVWMTPAEHQAIKRILERCT